MQITFEGEIDFICRKIAMCEQWKSGCCHKQLEPDQCERARNAVRKLSDRLVLGNSGQLRMLDEEVRVCHDMYTCMH